MLSLAQHDQACPRRAWLDLVPDIQLVCPGIQWLQLPGTGLLALIRPCITIHKNKLRTDGISIWSDNRVENFIMVANSSQWTILEDKYHVCRSTVRLCHVHNNHVGLHYGFLIYFFFHLHTLPLQSIMSRQNLGSDVTKTRDNQQQSNLHVFCPYLTRQDADHFIIYCAESSRKIWALSPYPMCI